MIEILLPGEEASILAQAKDESERDYFMILLALNTGLRNSELVLLNVRDFYDYGTVLKQLELRKVTTKGQKPRTIPLALIVQEAFSNYMNWKFSTREPAGPDDPLFMSSRSKLRLGPRDFQRIVKYYSEKTIRRSVHPHVLRHTFATKLLKKTNMRVVQELLGHVRLSSTQIYTHVSSADLYQAIEDLNR